MNGESRGLVLRVLDCALASFEILAGLIDVPLPLNKVKILSVSQYLFGFRPNNLYNILMATAMTLNINIIIVLKNFCCSLLGIFKKL